MGDNTFVMCHSPYAKGYTFCQFASCLVIRFRKFNSYCFPPTAHYQRLTTHYPLPTTHYPLPTTHYPLPTTHYPLPTTHYQLLTTNYSLPTTRYKLFALFAVPWLEFTFPTSRNSKVYSSLLVDKIFIWIAFFSA